MRNPLSLAHFHVKRCQPCHFHSQNVLCFKWDHFHAYIGFWEPGMVKPKVVCLLCDNIGQYASLLGQVTSIYWRFTALWTTPLFLFDFLLCLDRSLMISGCSKT